MSWVRIPLVTLKSPTFTVGLFCRVPSGLQPHVMRNGFSPFRCRGRGSPVGSHAPSPPRPALGGYPQRSWGRGGRPRRGKAPDGPVQGTLRSKVVRAIGQTRSVCPQGEPPVWWRRSKTTGHPLPAPCPQGMLYLSYARTTAPFRGTRTRPDNFSQNHVRLTLLFSYEE